MKSKIIKIIGLTLFSISSCYIVKNWNLFNSLNTIEPKNVELSQCKLDISKIETKYQPIWHIKTENPIVAYTIVFKNEGKKNFSKQRGLLSLIEEALCDGAGEHDSFALKQLFIDNNIDLSIDFTNDNAIVSIYTTVDNFELSVNLLTTILTKAHFDPKKLEITKQKIAIALAQNKFSAKFLACEKLSQTMFDEKHPYRMDLEATLNKIPTYTKKDCDECYAKLFTAENAMITFAGSISVDTAEKQFTKLLNSLSAVKHNNFKDSTQRPDFDNYGKRIHVDVDNSQSTVCFAMPFVAKNSSDRFACRLANNVFGGTSAVFANRLFNEVRDKQGLTYGIYTHCREDDLVSVLYGEGDTRPENVEQLIKATKDVIKKFAEEGITKEELDYHKTAIFSRNVFESTRGVVKFVTSCRLDDIQYKYVNNYLSNYYNLTLESVNTVIKQYFDCNKLVIVSAGKKIKEA